MVRGDVHGDRPSAIVPNEATAQEGGPPGRHREGNEAQKKISMSEIPQRGVGARQRAVSERLTGKGRA